MTGGQILIAIAGVLLIILGIVAFVQRSLRHRRPFVSWDFAEGVDDHAADFTLIGLGILLVYVAVH